MAEYKTITGRRTDLEAIEVNPIYGYVGDFIFPNLQVRQKAGVQTAMGLVADVDAETGRTPGAEVNTTLVSGVAKNYSCSEIIKSFGVTKSETKQYGGVEYADRVGAIGSKRSVLRQQEKNKIEALFAIGTPTDIGSNIIAGIEAGIDAIARYAGKTAFVVGKTAYRWIVQQQEITDRLKENFGNGSLNQEDVLSRKVKLFTAMLQQLGGVDEVLVFDDTAINLTTYAGYGSVCKLPNPDMVSHKIDPVLGKNMLFLPDGTQSFEIESYYVEKTKVNTYDCTSWEDVVIFNAGAAYTVNGLVTA